MESCGNMTMNYHGVPRLPAIFQAGPLDRSDGSRGLAWDVSRSRDILRHPAEEHGVSARTRP